MFAAWAVPSFRWVWGGALSGNSGRFAVILVAGWEAYRLGHQSSVWPSLVSMLLLLPSMFFGLFAGSIADRRNRALLAGGGQLVNAAACGVAALLTAAGRLDLAVLLALTAVVGIGNAVQGPAWQALIPQLVGPHRLINAGMTARIAQQGAELTGPALGTVVLTSAGPAPAFLLCALLYVVGAGMFHQVRGAGGAPRAEHAGLLRPIAEGVSYLRREKPLGTLLFWVGLHCSLTMASLGILPAVATTNLRGDAAAYGLLLAGFGFGSVMGPLLMMALGRRAAAVPILTVSAVLSGLPLISLGLVHRIGVDLVSAAVAGAAQAVFMAGIYAANQGRSVDAMRGRVASVQLSLTTGAMGVASIGWGALAGAMAAGSVLALPGAAFVLVSIPFALRGRRIAVALAGAAQPALPDAPLTALRPAAGQSR